MTGAQKKRLLLIVMLVSGLSLTTALILYALSKNINLFYTPTQLVEEPLSDNQIIRLGGMVVKGSLQRKEGMEVEFVLTDFNQDIHITYQGILPDLFREGQGVVAEGKLSKKGYFKAFRVLAKHDEKYMPPEVADAVKKGKGKYDGA